MTKRVVEREAKRKLVLFDIGGVIANLDWSSWLKKLADCFHTTPQGIVDFLCRENIKDDLSREGLLFFQMESSFIKWPPVEIYNEFVRYFFRPELSYKEFEGAFNSCLSISRNFKEIESLSSDLEANGALQGILSNINAMHMEYAEDFFKVYTPILNTNIPKERRFYSCELGVRKGEHSRAFLLACEKSGTRPEDSCLIDDRAENIRGVLRERGKGIWHTSAEKTRHKLVELDYLPKECLRHSK